VPTGLDLEQVNRAIRTALGGEYSVRSDRWVDQEIKGQWYFEGQGDRLIYGGFSVRSHYLQLAITYDETEVISVVCDSINLKQTSSSIHRKVPQWKTRLDSKIRQELGQVSGLADMQDPGTKLAIDELADDLVKLDGLRKAGVISVDEFTALKERAIERAVE